jgi:NAD(P)-dependent dehydrogenase (short-subunit alcohol dehydrogenase family)
MSRLQNKVAVTTGGTSGMDWRRRSGSSLKEGSCISSRRQQLDKTVASIGRNIVGAQGDVHKLEELDRLYAKVACQWRHDHRMSHSRVARYRR